MNDVDDPIVREPCKVPRNLWGGQQIQFVARCHPIKTLYGRPE